MAKSRFLEKKTTTATILYSRRIKAVLDPKNILNPGLYTPGGGIEGSKAHSLGTGTGRWRVRDVTPAGRVGSGSSVFYPLGYLNHAGFRLPPGFPRNEDSEIPCNSNIA